jgi:ABC-2 type transport system permease protein
MTLAGIVKDPETASSLGNLIAFPMMLLSGTFWSISAMPVYLQTLAWALPLTYFADGLRSSMVYGASLSALTDLAVVAAFALVLVLIGSRLTRWSED